MEKRLENIAQMEEILNRMTDFMQELRKIHTQWKDMQPDFQKLMNYYEDGRWIDDYEAYERGEIPQNMPCGVLSEDAIFNLLSEQHTMAVSMIKLSADILDS